MGESKKKSAFRDKRVRVGIVIVNYNSGDYLEKCVRSILRSRTPADIAIVDNGSGDGSLKFVSGIDTGMHSLVVIKNKENLGFSRAVNRGVLALENRFILLLNPDCTIFPGTLLKLQKGMLSGRDIAIAGALVFNEDGSEQRGCRRNEPTFKRSMVTALGLGRRFEGVDRTWEPLPSRPSSVDAVSGAAMMVRREYFDRVGGMDEDYFLHCEDLDLCRRMRDFGYRVVICPDVAVFHRQGGSGNTTSNTVEKHKHRGMLVYNKKHRNQKTKLAERIGIPAMIYCHFGVIALKNTVTGAFSGLIAGKRSKPADSRPFTTLELTDSGKSTILITGGKSDVGDHLLRILVAAGYNCIAVSRSSGPEGQGAEGVNWLGLEYFMKAAGDDFPEMEAWINLAPVWTTKTLYRVLGKFKPNRIISVSSTSIEGKADSENEQDIQTVDKLISGEDWLSSLQEKTGTPIAILRPTLIYGGPRNQNVNFIESVIRIFWLFPVVGEGAGKRQPVHAEDVAIACQRLLTCNKPGLVTYNIGGGEVLNYREMVGRIFVKLARKERILSIPMSVAEFIVVAVRWIPGLRFLNTEMVKRMESDLVYSNDRAVKDFSYQPRDFQP